MPQADNGIRGKPRAGVGKRDRADFRRRDGHKDKKGRGSHRREGGGGDRLDGYDVGARDNSTVMAAGKGAHLHVSVYKTGKSKGEDLFTDTYITKYKVNDKWKSDMVNPFDHKIERRF